MEFYNKKEEEERIAYIPVVRKQILERIEDLKQKIISNEPLPEKQQDIDTLVEIYDHLDACLNNWYY